LSIHVLASRRLAPSRLLSAAGFCLFVAVQQTIELAGPLTLAAKRRSLPTG